MVYDTLTAGPSAFRRECTGILVGSNSFGPAKRKIDVDMKITLLVIRTVNPETLKSQYEQIGLQFDHHQHGNGSFHYASENDGFVFEIYPLLKSMEVADRSIRLGFEVENLAGIIDKISNTDWEMIAEIQNTEWGETAVVQDLDGSKIPNKL